MTILIGLRFFLSELLLCKTWPMHVLQNLSLIKHEIPYIAFMNSLELKKILARFKNIKK